MKVWVANVVLVSEIVLRCIYDFHPPLSDFPGSYPEP